MKQAVLLIYAFTVIATLTVADNIQGVANRIGLTRTEVQTCFNETNVTAEDIMLFVEMSVELADTRLIDKATLKVGCFLACIFQKKELMSGANINLDKWKQLLPKNNNINPQVIKSREKIFNTCFRQVRSKTDECEITMQFVLCAGRKIRLLEHRISKN